MTPSPAAPGSSFFYPHSLSHNIYFHPHSLTYNIHFSFSLPFCQYLFSHPLSPSSNIHFSFSLPFCQYQIFTLGLAVPIINPHFCTCAAWSTAREFVFLRRRFVQMKKRDKFHIQVGMSAGTAADGPAAVGTAADGAATACIAPSGIAADSATAAGAIADGTTAAGTAADDTAADGAATAGTAASIVDSAAAGRGAPTQLRSGRKRRCLASAL